jgi:hypothetical protein
MLRAGARDRREITETAPQLVRLLVKVPFLAPELWGASLSKKPSGRGRLRARGTSTGLRSTIRRAAKKNLLTHLLNSALYLPGGFTGIVSSIWLLFSTP